MSNTLPRILIISSSPFSKTSNNGKTLSSFFSAYDKDKIAQVSFTSGKGDADVCRNYFFITLSDIIKGRQGVSYDVITPNASPQPQTSQNIGYKIFHWFSGKRFPFAVFIKNRLWRHADYNAANTWIDQFRPEVVFFQGFSMEYGYRFAMATCKRLNIPMILELTDDYTENIYKWSLFGACNQNSYLSIFKETIAYAYRTIVISEQMRSEYSQRFSGSMVVMMNSVPIPTVFDASSERNTSDYVYAGNLLLGRWKVLINLSKALKSIDDKAVLSIYTPDSPSRSILNSLKKEGNIYYGGSLSSRELSARLSKCTAVIHSESFAPFNRKITRLSISTKIPEYMASGALIIAIGPPDIASMNYLQSNRVAICLSDNSVENIINELRRYTKDNSTRVLVENAHALCDKYHNISINAKMINELLVDAVQKVHTLY